MMNFLLRLKRFCGFLVGWVFFIGGLLKLMDPTGAGLVMGEYLDFLHLKFLGFAAKSLGGVFALAETVIGIALITGVWRKVTGLIAIIFQIFFTLLTLALVIFNPEMDCGCFGEAVHLTHMQTFLKNIVLCAMLAAYFFPSKLLGRPRSRKYVSFALVTISSICFGIYSWMYIPLVDYTDYKAGAIIKAADTAEEDIYDAVFIYEKDGVEEIFELEALPDSTWTFVRTETSVKESKESGKNLDLSFYDEEGNYMDHLAAEGRVAVVSVYKFTNGNNFWKNVAGIINDSKSVGFKPILLISLSPEQLEDAFKKLSPEIVEVLKSHLYISDYKILIAMNRSNGGVTYFNDGYLIRKWARRAVPELKGLEEISREDVTETIIDHGTKGNLAFQGFLLYVFAVMLLL